MLLLLHLLDFQETKKTRLLLKAGLRVLECLRNTCPTRWRHGPGCVQHRRVILFRTPYRSRGEASNGFGAAIRTRLWEVSWTVTSPGRHKSMRPTKLDDRQDHRRAMVGLGRPTGAVGQEEWPNALGDGRIA